MKKFDFFYFINLNLNLNINLKILNVENKMEQTQKSETKNQTNQNDVNIDIFEQYSYSSMSETNGQFCGLCCICLCIVSPILIYGLFLTISLINDYNITKICPHNHMWLYVLLSYITNYGKMLYKNSNNNQMRINCALIFLLVFVIWGFIEISNNQCSEIKKTNLYIFFYIEFVVNIINLLIAYNYFLNYSNQRNNSINFNENNNNVSENNENIGGNIGGNINV